MTEEKRYICGNCGREYKTKEACLKCENVHCVPKEIYDWSFLLDDRYPAIIHVKMSNGEVLTYERTGKMFFGKEV